MKCIVYEKGVTAVEIPQFEIDAMAPSLLPAVEKAFQNPDFCAKFETWKKERQEKPA